MAHPLDPWQSERQLAHEGAHPNHEIDPQDGECPSDSPYRIEHAPTFLHCDAFASLTAHPDYASDSFEEIRIREALGSVPATLHAAGSDARGGLQIAKVPFVRHSRVPAASIRAHRPLDLSIGSEVVAFHVGHEALRFTVHKNIIKIRSEFVRKALEGNWQESQGKDIRLPTDDPKVFAIYQAWLYFGELRSCGIEVNDKTSEYELLVRAYIFGEKLMDGDFKDALIDCIIEKLRTECTFDVQLTRTIHDGTPPGSALRRLWLDVYCHSGTASWLDVAQNDVHPDFLVEYDTHERHRLAGFGSREAKYMGDTCVYHEHGTRPCFRRKVRGLLPQQTEFGRVLAQYTAPIIPKPTPEPFDWRNFPVQSGVGPVFGITSGRRFVAGPHRRPPSPFTEPVRAGDHYDHGSTSASAHRLPKAWTGVDLATASMTAPSSELDTRAHVHSSPSTASDSLSNIDSVLEQLARLQRQLDELQVSTRGLPTLDQIVRSVDTALADHIIIAEENSACSEGSASS